VESPHSLATSAKRTTTVKEIFDVEATPETKNLDVYEKKWGEKGNGTVPPPRQVPFSRVACETTTHE